MGNSQFQVRRARNAASNVFSTACVETAGVRLAPQVGLEPTTLRLTAEQLVAASRDKHATYECKNLVLSEIGGTLGVLSEDPDIGEPNR